ncbi:MAG: FAD-dependent oxidoreductase, partial [Methanoregulaceae archaeon]|nr:FAD-dependent oxidoreductase [Methanoregulaceae archaeon]
MPDVHDLAVIGTGNAGTTVAFECKKAGWSVAVIEKGLVGGTCALRGCIPKKVLVGAAETVSAARRMHGKGVKGEVKIEWKDLIRFKRTFTDRTPVRRENSYLQAGIDTWHGAARFTGPNTLMAGGEKISARHI